MEHCNEQVGGGFRPPDGVCRLLILLYAPACYAQAGCKQAAVERENVLVAISLAGVAQVVICHNHLSSQEEVSHALTHELIHAYDHCRSRDLNWSNCEHHACSEARPLLQSCLLGIIWSLERDQSAAGATAPALRFCRYTGFYLLL